MAALEREAGIQLFERAGRLRVPTEAAHELADRGRVAMAALAEADRTAEELRGLRGGGPRSGPTESPGVYRVPAMLGEFAKRHPDVELRMDIADGTELIRRLRVRDLDVGVPCAPTPAEGILDGAAVPRAPGGRLGSGLADGLGQGRRWSASWSSRSSPASWGRASARPWTAGRSSTDLPAALDGAGFARGHEASRRQRSGRAGVLPEAGVRAEAAEGRLRVGRLPGTPLKARVDLAVLEGRRRSGPLESFLRGALGSRAGR